jgi:hypothetical protein
MSLRRIGTVVDLFPSGGCSEDKWYSPDIYLKAIAEDFMSMFNKPFCMGKF